MQHKPRLLFLFSDTGGGHRSAAEAVAEALAQIAGDSVEVTLLDFFRHYAPRPFNRFPELYPAMVKRPAGWAAGYRISNGPRRALYLQRMAWPYVRRSVRRILADHPAELVVIFHPLATDAVNRSMKHIPPEQRPALVVVVTDLVSTHAFWYHRQSDLTIVPTQAAYDHALRCGLQPGQLRLVGLPVAGGFHNPAADVPALRSELGWPLDRKMVLMVGGGDGMGPLERTAEAVASAGLPLGIAVIAGRNRALQARLAARKWPLPVFVYGFVRNMPELMQAADVLVSKAGPGTISEALNAGLPTVLYSFLPGQESGNVPYLTESGAGIWAPEPEQVVAGLRGWLEDPAAYVAAAEAARRLARPDAAAGIAGLLLERLGKPEMAVRINPEIG